MENNFEIWKINGGRKIDRLNLERKLRSLKEEEEKIVRNGNNGERWKIKKEMDVRIDWIHIIA